MMLNRALSTALTWHSKRFRLNLAFDRVLTVYEVWQDDLLDDDARLGLTFDLLIRSGRCRRQIAHEAPGEQAALAAQIFTDFINPKPRPGTGRRRAFDFQRDSDYIYASFLTDYGIDLLKERGRMDWRRFLALFQGLTDRTKMAQVMDIRLREIPAPDQYNAKERAALMEAKRYYALEGSEGEGIQDGLADLFGALKKWATM